jgi:hypothetical protein
MEDNPVIKTNDIYEWVDLFPPRPVLVQTGYDDQRVGTDLHQRFIAAMTRVYEARGAQGRFTHDPVPIPGHSGGPKPMSGIETVGK